MERAAVGHHQLDLVPDDDGIVHQVSVLGVLQHAPAHELAVSVAISRVGVLSSAADFHRALISLPSLRDVPVARAGLVHQREPVKGSNDAPAARVHHALGPRAFADECDEQRRVRVVVRRRSLLRLADAPLAVGVEEQDPLVATHREPVARDGLAIADTLEEGVAADDVLVLARDGDGDRLGLARERRLRRLCELRHGRWCV
mmetsp:Transcript_5859/g.26356  ORF Transcript_5859/g.26356 Transcript_5859/m.26356 type:complete len:202 (+) Transcript_5859:2439-3044(+)